MRTRQLEALLSGFSLREVSPHYAVNRAESGLPCGILPQVVSGPWGSDFLM
jgi:hypothetical protein